MLNRSSTLTMAGLICCMLLLSGRSNAELSCIEPKKVSHEAHPHTITALESMSTYIESLPSELKKTESSSLGLLNTKQQELAETYPHYNRLNLKATMLYEYCILLTSTNADTFAEQLDSMEALHELLNPPVKPAGRTECNPGRRLAVRC